MRIELSEIISCENKEMSKQVEIELSSFDSKLGQFPIIEKAPFVMKFTNENNKRLLIQGETEVTIAIPCDRCLEEVDRDFSIAVDKEIDLTGSREEISMDGLDYITGTNLDVDQLIFGEILVSWPMKVLCREDCKGICKRCGANLNQTECQCQKTEPDPRMAAIQDIFNKFKEV
ncbi:MAG: DUF177 domain-containing protein [Lachnospiraceae bacterium]|nr:DUF177 domain-containing protein [Lachnospiraceae bacterium]